MNEAPISSDAAAIKSLNDLPPLQELGVHGRGDKAEDRQGHHGDDHHFFARLYRKKGEDPGEVRRDVVGGEDPVGGTADSLTVRRVDDKL